MDPVLSVLLILKPIYRLPENLLHRPAHSLPLIRQRPVAGDRRSVKSPAVPSVFPALFTALFTVMDSGRVGEITR
jgi:hypothetical protein